MSQAEFKKRLKALMNKPENQVCSDCPERQPRWASLIVPPPGSPPGSLPIGAFCCLECSGSHRRLGVHISFVRSVTLDSWKEKEVLAMENGGNHKVNAIFEANLTVSKPLASASGPVRERFIRDKYERRKYYDPAVLQQYQNSSGSSSEESEDEAPQRPVVRAPSEAAKKRAQARKQRMGTVAALPKVRTEGSNKKSSAVQKRTAPAAPAPDVDLLDFGLPPVAADPGPPPNPPSASPSPTLDMFKDMNISNSAIPTSQQSYDSGLGGNGTSTQQNAAETKKKMTSDDILGLFNAPMNNSNNNMGYNNLYGNNNGMASNGMMSNGMMMNSMNNNQMGMMNMNNMTLSGQQVPSSSHNMVTNSNPQNGMMNPSMINSNNSMNQNNMSFFNNGVLSQMNQPNNMVNAMPQQQQQQDFGMNSMAPMGGTPSNLTVMGGSGMNEQRSIYGDNQDQQKNEAFDFMGGATVTTSSSTYSSENPQMNQFASFGSFR